jgi:HJR/Mrr/RecB family endonuclease
MSFLVGLLSGVLTGIIFLIILLKGCDITAEGNEGLAYLSAIFTVGLAYIGFYLGRAIYLSIEEKEFLKQNPHAGENPYELYMDRELLSDNSGKIEKIFKNAVDPNNKITQSDIFKRFINKYFDYFDVINDAAQFRIESEEEGYELYINMYHPNRTLIQFFSFILDDSNLIKDTFIEFTDSANKLLNNFSELASKKLNIKISEAELRNLVLSTIFISKVKDIKKEFSDTGKELILKYANTYQDAYKPEDIVCLYYLIYGFSSNKLFQDILNELEKISNEKEIVNLEQKLFSDDQEIISIEDIDACTGEEFEDFIADIFKREGYNTELTKSSGDQGVDIIASNLKEKVAIQTKRYSQNVTNKAIQEVIAGANFYDCDRSMVITNSYFTKSAIELAEANNVQLIDRNELESLIDKHFL